MKTAIKLELEVPDDYKLPKDPDDLLKELENRHSNVNLISSEYVLSEQKYYVCKNGARVMEFDSLSDALEHAVKIGGNICW